MGPPPLFFRLPKHEPRFSSFWKHPNRQARAIAVYSRRFPCGLLD